MSDARNTRDNAVCGFIEYRAENLVNSSYQHHNDCQNQTYVVQEHKISEQLVLFQIKGPRKQAHKQEHKHSQHQQMNMNLSENGFPEETIELGKFTVKYSADKSRHGVNQRKIKISLSHNKNYSPQSSL